MNGQATFAIDLAFLRRLTYVKLVFDFIARSVYSTQNCICLLFVNKYVISKERNLALNIYVAGAAQRGLVSLQVKLLRTDSFRSNIQPNIRKLLTLWLANNSNRTLSSYRS